jgi:hypothetical protein
VARSADRCAGARHARRGTWEEDTTELRRVDPATGRVQETLEMPVGVSGLEAKGDLFFCGGGGKTPVLRAVKRPSRK